MSGFTKYTDYNEWLKRVKEHGAVVFLRVSNGTVAQAKNGAALGLWDSRQGKGVIY